MHFSLCTIFSHVDHLVSRAGSSDTFFKLDTLMITVDKFGSICFSSFRGEDFCKITKIYQKMLKMDYKGQ